MIPTGVTQIRADLCGDCPTPCATKDLVFDPCATCPIGTWGRYTDQGCPPDLADPAALPGPATLARNLGRALVQETAAILGARPAPSADEIARRLEICRACPSGLHLVDSAGEDRCAHPRCGCYLRRKTAWRSQSCPAGHW